MTIKPLEQPANEIPAQLRNLAASIEEGTISPTTVMLILWDRVNEKTTPHRFGEPLYATHRMGLFFNAALNLQSEMS